MIDWSETLRLFASAEQAEFEGWRRVTLQGAQLSRRFREPAGAYRYGLFLLEAPTLLQLEAELVDPVADSTVQLAIIDTRHADWSPRQTSAFRHDLDFYVFTGTEQATVDALEAHLGPMEPAPVLCLVTPLSED